MKRRITGFHQDDERHWVAELDCGHNQHVRHNPPLSERPWVLTEAGRAPFLGRELDCLKCERGEAADRRMTVTGDDILTERLQKALNLAIQLHGRDSRKKSPVPCLAHLLAVCALVQHDGGDEDEAIAALLHDTLEDKPGEISREAITAEFGPRVMELIDAATDTAPDYAGGAKESWSVRKRRYLEHARHAAPDQLRVTVADKIDNVRAMIADYRRLGEPFWGNFNAGKDQQLWYYRGCIEAYREAGFSGALLIELERLVSELEGPGPKV